MKQHDGSQENPKLTPPEATGNPQCSNGPRTADDRRFAAVLKASVPAGDPSPTLQQRVASAAAGKRGSGRWSPPAWTRRAPSTPNTMMQAPPARLPWPAFLGFATFLALLLAPATSWLVKIQLRAPMEFVTATGSAQWFGPSTSPQPPSRPNPNSIQGVAWRHPEDLSLQILAAHSLKDLLPLRNRFPNSPELYANILRFACLTLRINRPEEDLVTGSPVPPDQARQAPPPADLMAIFFDAASRGERLEPQNAYFPLMAAAGDYAVHRDSQAMAALLRAGRASAWEDYSMEPAAQGWKQLQSFTGRQGAVAGLYVRSMVLLPQYAILRTVARMALYQAVQLERQGHFWRGLEVRHALMRTGGLMRAKSTPLIAGLVGDAIEAIGMSRPGGAPVPKPNLTAPQASPAKRTALRLAAYTSYLRKIGHPEEARWAAAETAADTQNRDIARRGIALSIYGGRPLSNLGSYWLADVALIANALWLVILGGAATLLAYRRMERSALLLIGALAVILTFAMLAWQYQWSLALVALQQSIAQMFGEDQIGGLATTLMALAAAIVIPAATLMILSAVSLVRRVPLSLGLTEGLRRVAAPLACILTLLYGAAIIGTVHQENRVEYGLFQMDRGEGQYYARLLHTTWPGLTPEPRR